MSIELSGPPLRATYRLQLTPDAGFDAAAGLADYFAALGVSHLYTSPYLQAAPGSRHGYDVVDPRRVNRELGGAEAQERMVARLHEQGLGHVIDLVPNHMAITGAENPWWWDVLENGQASRYARYFDVEWHAPEERLRDVVLLPVLSDHYGRVLEDGRLRLERTGGRFDVRYAEHVFPVAPRSLDRLLGEAAAASGSDRLAFIADVLAGLPPSNEVDDASIDRRHRDKEIARGLLEDLARDEPQTAAAIDEVVARINADADALDDLLSRQNYRLAFWRTAGSNVSHRRFFDVDTLVGLRQERERVFRETHELVLSWAESEVVDGMRVDHPDGLRDPQQYLERLRAAAPHAWIVVEKILEPGERLRERWPVQGTTGYDFLELVGGLFIDGDGEGPLSDVYADFVGERLDYHEITHETRYLVLSQTLGSDLNRLTALLSDVAEGHRRHRDYTRHQLFSTLREILAAFPVYRTYVRADAGQMDDADVRYVNDAIAAARARRADLGEDLFDFIADLLTLRLTGEREAEFVMRFQQLSSAVMAKGVEDTAFYRYLRLLSLNEVGCDPALFGRSLDAFHARCVEMRQRRPLAMLTTSTHDTKRSEDVRARISLLSEMPEAWGDAVRRWRGMNERHRRDGEPDRNMEYLIYQTLVGAWPIETERMLAYVTKAAREARVHTSWIDVNATYESALTAFVLGILGDDDFRADMGAFVAPLVRLGRVNSLAQTLLKLTAPGIPDIYQGCELWDLSLVDPDNRRPVDWDRRRELLAWLGDGCSPEEIMAREDDGAPKLWVIRQALRLRRDRAEAFGPRGVYAPLNAKGARAAHVVAFSRGETTVTVAPRLVHGLGGDWRDTELELPAGRWRDVLTGTERPGGPRPMTELLGRFPVALLDRTGA